MAKWISHQLHLYLKFPGPELQHAKGGVRNAPIFQDMFNCYSKVRTWEFHFSHYSGFSPILTYISTQGIPHQCFTLQYSTKLLYSTVLLHIKFVSSSQSYLFMARLKLRFVQFDLHLPHYSCIYWHTLKLC